MDQLIEIYGQYGFVSVVFAIILWYVFNSLNESKKQKERSDKRIDALEEEVRGMWREYVKFQGDVMDDMAEHNKKLVSVLEQNQIHNDRNADIFAKIWGHAAAVMDIKKT
jgi:hypothetical protein